MPEPDVAQRGPYLLELMPGSYLWCSCGRSRSQPFCDGSHRGTAFQPMRFTIEPVSRGFRGLPVAVRAGRTIGVGAPSTADKPQTVWLCGCKRAKTAPFCDGSHNKLPP